MTVREINALLALRGLTVQIIADDIGEKNDRVSATINKLRTNRKIRAKIAARLGMTVEELFDDEQAKAVA
jgi:hypothetical protein